MVLPGFLISICVFGATAFVSSVLLNPHFSKDFLTVIIIGVPTALRGSSAQSHGSAQFFS